MNDPLLEAEVKKQYGIETTIIFTRIDSDDYEVSISANGKTAILHEHMRNGLTKHVILTTDKVLTYKKYNEAESDAIEYLKG